MRNLLFSDSFFNDSLLSENHFLYNQREVQAWMNSCERPQQDEHQDEHPDDVKHVLCTWSDFFYNQVNAILNFTIPKENQINFAKAIKDHLLQLQTNNLAKYSSVYQNFIGKEYNGIDISNINFFDALEGTKKLLQPYQRLLEYLSFYSTFEEHDALVKIQELCNLSDEKPEWNIECNFGKVEPEVLSEDPYSNLLRFTPKNIETVRDIPKKVFLIAPLSGHYATLLTTTVKNYLERGMIVDVTDWNNSKHIPENEENGVFDLDIYTETVINYSQLSGANSNMVAVCQAGPCTLAALAHLSKLESEDKKINGQKVILPHHLTLIASPLDTSINPTEVNKLAEKHDIEWFQKNMIHEVLDGPAKGRKVYPGELQDLCFIGPNIDSRLNDMCRLFQDLRDGNHEKAQKQIKFFTEYFHCCSLSEQFYLQTIHYFFHNSGLESMKNGSFTYKGEKIDLSKIKDTKISTIEGKNDDITGLGQTTAIKEHLSDGVYQGNLLLETGHYGAFVKNESADFVDSQITEGIKKKYIEAMEDFYKFED